MDAYINNLELSSESDDCDHPNIDKRSFIAYKRSQKEQEKKQKQCRLSELNNLLHKTNNQEEKDFIQNEIQKLEFTLSDKITETQSCTVFGEPSDRSEDKYINDLIHLLNHNSLDDFITFLDSNHVNVEYFEELVLHNLSENIKEGNDDIGVDMARLSIYLKYAKNEGRSFLTTLCMAIRDENKKKLFEDECKNHYLMAKDAILNMKE